MGIDMMNKMTYVRTVVRIRDKDNLKPIRFTTYSVVFLFISEVGNAATKQRSAED